jgi:hypothetical protein
VRTAADRNPGHGGSSRHTAGIPALALAVALTLFGSGCTDSQGARNLGNPSIKADAICGSSLNRKAAESFVSLTGRDTFYEPPASTTEIADYLRMQEKGISNHIGSAAVDCLISSYPPNSPYLSVSALVRLWWRQGGEYVPPPAQRRPQHPEEHSPSLTYFSIGSEAYSSDSRAVISVPCVLHSTPNTPRAEDRKYLNVAFSTSPPPGTSGKITGPRRRAMAMTIANSVAYTFSRALGCKEPTGIEAEPDLTPLP